MKLMNHTSRYFAAVLLVIITLWAAIFYYSMLNEIYDSIDDGLDNQKGLVIQKAATDSTVLNKDDFGESDYTIREITAAGIADMKDVYLDTMMYMQNEKSDEPVRLLKTVFLQHGKYYQLQVATSMVEEDDLIKQLFYSVLWLYLGLVITIIIFNNFLLKKIWRPFYQLLSQLKNFRLDKPKPLKLGTTKIDEFRLLEETVEKFLQQSVETYRNQKDFIENAAHELQTPLAVSIGKLEMLAENNELPENQLQLLASALDNLERMTRLNKSLLLLSRIENKQFTEEKTVSINEITKSIIADFSDQSIFAGLTITVEEKGDNTQKMNEDLAIILLTNIIKNAIIHNKPGGRVHIVIERYLLTVENTGTETALSEKIFNRFHSGGSSQTSTGLGLAIVKAITDLYQFRVAYSRQNQHHRFNIHFTS